MGIQDDAASKPRPWQEIILDAAGEADPAKLTKLRDELEASLDARDGRLHDHSGNPLRERADSAIRAAQREIAFAESIRHESEEQKRRALKIWEKLRKIGNKPS